MTQALGTGFTDDGQRYVVRDVDFVKVADHVLWNDRMTAHVTHRGHVNSTFLQPNGTGFAREDRLFYVRDDKTGKKWAAPYNAIQEPLDKFECSLGVGDVAWTVENDGIEVKTRISIPREDLVELWSASVRNTTRRTRSISFYACFPVWALSWYSASAVYDRKLGGMVYDYFPYYVKHQDYEGKTKLHNTVFCFTDKKPSSHDIRLGEFLGNGGVNAPAGLDAPRLGNSDKAVIETSAGIFHYKLTLKPGQEWSGNFIFGPALDRAHAAKLQKRYLKKDAIEKAIRKTYSFYKKHGPTVKIQTPDVELNHFVNNWLPVQTLRIGRTLRHISCASARNALIDAVGATYTDPDQVRRWYPVIFQVQEECGYLPHGIPMFPGVVPGGINIIRHRDAAAWAPPLMLDYLCETGDMSVLDLKARWKETAKKSTIYEHLCRGMDWQLKDRSKRGLSYIGEGDWNDPLNMAGYKGKGESIWLTEALSHGLQCMAKICEQRGDTARAKKYTKGAEDCNRAINKYGWDGDWYIRGTTDAGKPFGSKKNKEGRIYLNPQGWALICGAATKARKEKSLAAVKKHLSTKEGPLMLAPAYTRFYDDVGKLSQKIAGMEENGSNYCHASLFFAHGLYTARLADEAYDAFRIILPGYKANTVKRSGQVPLYVTTYFRGPAVGPTEGKSSCESTTGSAPWFYRIAIAMMMGIRGDFDGLHIDPQLPSKWPGASAVRKFRGATYNIEIKRSKKVKRTTVTIDGEKIKGTLIPEQKAGTRHKIVCLVP